VAEIVFDVAAPEAEPARERRYQPGAQSTNVSKLVRVNHAL
jgi:hypothetical protein